MHICNNNKVPLKGMPNQIKQLKHDMQMLTRSAKQQKKQLHCGPKKKRTK